MGKHTGQNIRYLRGSPEVQAMKLLKYPRLIEALIGDVPLKKRWQDIQAKFREGGFELPALPSGHFLIKEADDIQLATEEFLLAIDPTLTFEERSEIILNFASQLMNEVEQAT
jgi:hypothetical protein